MNFIPSGNAQNQATSFTFRKRNARIDWRKLAAVDVDKVARELDVASLQDNLCNVAFCNIDGEEFQGLDPHFMKLFKLAQLTLEYLVYTQQCLNGQVVELQQKLKTVSDELNLCQKDLVTRNEDLKIVKKENRKRRKAIESYQEMLSSGATGVHPCPVCRREFITGDFLQSHIDRRHPEHPSSKSRISEDFQARLMQQVTDKVKESERLFKEELSLRERRTRDEREREFEEWKRAERQRHEEEMDRVRKPLLEMIEKLQQDKQQAEVSAMEQKELLTTAQMQLSKAKEDTAKVQEQAKILSERESLRKGQIDAEIESLKATFTEQVNDLKREQKKRSKTWRKDMEEMRSAYERQLSESQLKMNSLEQTLQSTWREGQREAEQALTTQIEDLQRQLKGQQKVIHQQSKHIEELTLKSTSTTPVHFIQAPAYPEGEGTTSSSSGEESVEDAVDGPPQPSTTPQPQLPSHAPYHKWPMIKTHYHHSPEELQNVHMKLNKVVQEALEQRGVLKHCDGLTDSEFENKMRILTEQRPKWEESYLNFTSCRESVRAEVESIAGATFSPLQHGKKKKKKKQLIGQNENDGSPSHRPPPSPTHTGQNVQLGKPPRSPTPTGGHSSPPVSSGVGPHSPHHTSASLSTVHHPITQSTGHTTNTYRVQRMVPEPSVKPTTEEQGHLDSSESDSEWTSTTSDEEEDGDPTPQAVQNQSPSRVISVSSTAQQQQHMHQYQQNQSSHKQQQQQQQQHHHQQQQQQLQPQQRHQRLQQQKLQQQLQQHQQQQHQQQQQHGQIKDASKVPVIPSVVEGTVRNDNSWDTSSDDEIEQLAVQTISGTGRASSTPIKSSKTGKVHQLASSLTFGTDPSKRPPGGIPIIGSIESGISEIKPFYGSEPEDVFSDTESSINVSEAAMQGGGLQCRDQLTAAKTISQPPTSRSALTTVTPVTVEDLTDSDFDL